MNKKNFIEEITWRGLKDSSTHGTDEIFNSKTQLVGYIGFDPTASNLHIGNLAAIHLLKHFQLCGHKPLIIVGGGTGFIGDPSGKSKERSFLSKEKIEENVKSLEIEFRKFLDFDCGDLSAEILNNLDWLGSIQFIDFLRDVGKLISVNEMIKKDSVKNRLTGLGISYTEFSYQVLQAYDFYWLKKNKNCNIQMGGSDQWGNIVCGIDVIGKKLNEKGYGLTLPLVQKADGGKFGKTEEGNIWLNPSLTSPFKFYQFWRNISDDDISKLIRIFTFWDRSKVEDLDKIAISNPNYVKELLADEMMKYIHKPEDFEKAKTISSILYGKNTIADLENIDEQNLIDSSEGMQKLTITRDEFVSFNNSIDLISRCMNISKSEARRSIANNGISINKTKISSDEANNPPKYSLIKERFLLFQKGKLYSLITVN